MQRLHRAVGGRAPQACTAPLDDPVADGRAENAMERAVFACAKSQGRVDSQAVYVTPVASTEHTVSETIRWRVTCEQKFGKT